MLVRGFKSLQQQQQRYIRRFHQQANDTITKKKRLLYCNREATNRSVRVEQPPTFQNKCLLMTCIDL